MTEEEVINKLLDHRYKYIFLDRFDLYASNNICKTLCKLEESSVIFCDTKNLNVAEPLLPIMVDIDIKDDVLEVAGCL